MSTTKSKWKMVRELMNSEPITLGPFYSSQLKGHWSLLRTMARYKFVANLVEGKNVLDIGCGEGLGTKMLGKYTKVILGVDDDKKAMDWAFKDESKNIFFNEVNFFDMVDVDFFDAVIAIDVIEHIDKSKEDSFINKICRCLNSNGFCIIGTPNINMKEYESKEAKAGHVNMYDEKRLKELIGKYFENVFIFGMNDEVVYTGFKPMCQYLFAIGVNKK